MKSGYKAAENEVVGKMKIKVFATEGIHPQVVAISSSLGMQYGGRVAKGKTGKEQRGW